MDEVRTAIRPGPPHRRMIFFFRKRAGHAGLLITNGMIITIIANIPLVVNNC